MLTLSQFFPRRSAIDTHYFLRAVPCQLGGLGFEVEHLQADGGAVYHARLDGAKSTCDCPGFEHHRRCKHVSALLALQAKGKLPAPPPAGKRVQVPATVRGDAPAPRPVRVPATLTGAPDGWDDL